MVSRRHYICLPCRYDGHSTQCPYCKGEAIGMGAKFRAPARRNLKAWRALQMRLENKDGHTAICVEARALLRSGSCWCYLDFSKKVQITKKLADMTVSDVKSRYGLRRSQSKKWAPKPKAKPRSTVPQRIRVREY